METGRLFAKTSPLSVFVPDERDKKPSSCFDLAFAKCRPFFVWSTVYTLLLLESWEIQPLSWLKAAMTSCAFSRDVYLPFALPASNVSEDLFRAVGHRQAHNHILQAEIAIDQSQYPVAAMLAEEALTYLERLQSRSQIKKLVRICSMLKQSPYGDSEDVRMLEIKLTRSLYPELFC